MDLIAQFKNGNTAIAAIFYKTTREKAEKQIKDQYPSAFAIVLKPTLRASTLKQHLIGQY